jgi:hypothetical protein
MIDESAIINELQKIKWPEVVTSDVRIREINSLLVIEMPTIPMKIVYVFMTVVYIVIVMLAIWKDKSMLTIIIPFGFAAMVGFGVLLKYINNKQQKVGPLSIIGREVLNYRGDKIPINEIDNVYDVYFKKRGSPSSEGYRLVFIESNGALYPILWQITDPGKWTRPACEIISKKLNKPIHTIIIGAMITAA